MMTSTTKFTPPESGKLLILIPMTVLAMVVSWANLESQFMATAEPVFLMDPIKADLLALIIVFAPVAAKSAIDFIKSEHRKYMCRLMLGCACGVSLVTWLVLSAYVFNGIGTSEEAVQASDFIINTQFLMQMLTELLAASVLYMATFDILEKNFPKAQYPNPFHRMQRAKVDALNDAHKAAEMRYQKSVAAAAQHRTNRALFIKEQEQAVATKILQFDTLFND